MDDVLRGCATFAVVYIDDILIFSDSMGEHLSHITEVMKSLKKAGLKVKQTKCQWGARQFEYLGHEIGNGQVAVPEHRVQAMMEFKQPVTKRDMINSKSSSYVGSTGKDDSFSPPIVPW